jgi:hypothetical protein
MGVGGIFLDDETEDGETSLEDIEDDEDFDEDDYDDDEDGPIGFGEDYEGEFQ